MESMDISSTWPILSASEIAVLVLPDAVGPTRAKRTGD
jgi:hypothetical protein